MFSSFGLGRSVNWGGRLVLVLALGAAVGCGSSGSSSSSSSAPASTTAASSGGSNNCMTEATQVVDSAKKPIKFSVASAPLDFSKAKGKDVWFISPTQAIPFVEQISNGFVAGAKAAGLTPHVFDGKGDVNNFNSGISQAVSQKAAGIVLQGIDPSVVKGTLANAKKAGIAVIDSFSSSPNAPLAPGVGAHVTADFTADGKVMADYILQATKCKADVVALGSTIFTVHKDINNAIQTEFKRICASCKFSFNNIDTTQIATTAAPTTQTALNRDPNVNFLVADNDGMAPYMVQAVQQAGKKIPLIGHDGVDSSLKFIREGKVQVADFAFPPTPSIGWAEVDQLGRVMTGQGQIKEDTIPSQLFDKTNLPAKTADQFPQYNGFESKYKAAWKPAQ